MTVVIGDAGQTTRGSEMSIKYKYGDIVPTDVLANRLDVLAQYIAEGIDNRKSHFYKNIPAEFDRDADLVMSAAARRLREYDAEIVKLKKLLENAEWLLVEQFMEAKKTELSSKITSYLYQNEAAK